MKTTNYNRSLFELRGELVAAYGLNWKEVARGKLNSIKAEREAKTKAIAEEKAKEAQFRNDVIRRNKQRIFIAGRAKVMIKLLDSQDGLCVPELRAKIPNLGSSTMRRIIDDLIADGSIFVSDKKRGYNNCASVYKVSAIIRGVSDG